MKQLLFLSAAILLLGGCKALESNDTYVLKGTLLQDCSGTPMALHKLRIHFEAYNFVNGPISEDVGFAVTDENGHFECNIPVKYQQNLSLMDEAGKGGRTWKENFSGPGNASQHLVLDLDIIYGEARLAGVAKLLINTGSFGSNDTLYVSNGGGSTETFNPVPPEATVVLDYAYSVPLGPEDIRPGTQIYWARGKAQYDSLLAPNWSGTLRKAHGLFINVALCTTPDTTVLALP